MKDQLLTSIAATLAALRASGGLAVPEPTPTISIERPRNPEHGDFSTNIAMLLAKPCRMSPLAIAEVVAKALAADPLLRRVEVVAPGFINFFVHHAALYDTLADIVRHPEQCGKVPASHAGRIQLEFVSANPTGPLHVGHGRGAAYGAALANLLRATGHQVATEYYVNDAGRQMDILALSIWLRYREHLGDTIVLPPNAYRGDYVLEIARDLAAVHGPRFHRTPSTSFIVDPAQDEEAALDAAIEHCRNTLGEADYRVLHAFGCDSILAGIKSDLEHFGVTFDRWYSERSLVDQGLLVAALTKLRATDYMFVKDGAEWFRSTAFGDEKDRVVVRENGAPTYFASDIAYHNDKFARGFTTALNIWGADHHGYIPRVKAALEALGLDPARLEILLVQFASLYREGQKVQMSTRSGQFVTLRELIDEVGVDAARYFYTSRRSDQHLDFDLSLAKAQSQDNPVYYLQYAHARICSVFRQVAQLGGHYEQEVGIAALPRLTEVRESALAQLATRYREVLIQAASKREPHAVANYLHELAAEYHGFYNTHKIIVDDVELRQARLTLCAAVRNVLRDGLALLGVSAPQEM